jgi:hypothetical protein
LVNSGIRLFRINGAYFHGKEYEKLMTDLDAVFKNTNDRPTVIFDLKGPIPRITKIGLGKTSIEVKKDQLLKIVHENPKIDDPDIIQVDKKITQCINVGDKIVIDSSRCVLKVISIERYKRKNSFCKLPGHKSSSRLVNKVEFDFEENEILTEDEVSNKFFLNFSNIFNNQGGLPTIEEEKENGVFQVDDNMDFSIEERLMQKQTNMKLAYQNIIKKHKNYNDFNKINELDRFSVDISEDGSNVYSSRKKLKNNSKF